MDNSGLWTLLKNCRQKLISFIEDSNNATLKYGDFERVGKKIEKPSPFEYQESNGGEHNDYIDEGRKSYLMIKNKKNWPPTTDDLLEYINIYSQLNSIKFVSLNHDRYFHGEMKHEKKGKKKHNQTVQEEGKRAKKWRSISKSEFSFVNFTPREETVAGKESRLKSLAMVWS